MSLEMSSLSARIHRNRCDPCGQELRTVPAGIGQIVGGAYESELLIGASVLPLGLGWDDIIYSIYGELCEVLKYVITSINNLLSSLFIISSKNCERIKVCFSHKLT